jgi:hypothetical protein
MCDVDSPGVKSDHRAKNGLMVSPDVLIEFIEVAVWCLSQYLKHPKNVGEESPV